MRILLLILIPPILLLFLALALMWLPPPQPLPAFLTQERDQIAALVTGCLGIVWLIGLALYLLLSFRKVGRVWDALFTGRGLAPGDYALFGRQYRGLVEDRDVEVRFMPGHGLRSPLLDVRVVADLRLRVAIGERKPLLDCGRCPRLDGSDLGLGSLQIFTEEADRTRGLLAEPTVNACLLRLMSGQEWYSLRQLYIQPGRIWLRARPSSGITHAQIGGWFDDMLRLAEAAESGPGSFAAPDNPGII
jgi:hypothetical protein